jgi:hypothetical protein
MMREALLMGATLVQQANSVHSQLHSHACAVAQLSNQMTAVLRCAVLRVLEGAGGAVLRVLGGAVLPSMGLSFCTQLACYSFVPSLGCGVAGADSLQPMRPPRWVLLALHTGATALHLAAEQGHLQVGRCTKTLAQVLDDSSAAQVTQAVVSAHKEGHGLSQLEAHIKLQATVTAANYTACLPRTGLCLSIDMQVALSLLKSFMDRSTAAGNSGGPAPVDPRTCKDAGGLKPHQVCVCAVEAFDEACCPVLSEPQDCCS